MLKVNEDSGQEHKKGEEEKEEGEMEKKEKEEEEEVWDEERSKEWRRRRGRTGDNKRPMRMYIKTGGLT